MAFLSLSGNSSGQCLSSVNPVGGTNNLLVLEKNSLRVISFYKFGQGDTYYEGNEQSSFDLIDRAWYNYLSCILGYGLTQKLTIEAETGYFINKTQKYNLAPEYRLRGNGFSNLVLLAKHSIYSEPVKRIYFTGSAGVKLPFSRNPQLTRNVELPVEVQPTSGAYGMVLNGSFVKENSSRGIRYFLTSRFESHTKNPNGYHPGNLWFNAVYVSKHLMFPWLKGDWTTIIQLRNEYRSYDWYNDQQKESSGSMLYFVSPQLNYVYKEQWYISAIIDFPVYQDFNGTQLGAGTGLTLILSKSFRL